MTRAPQRAERARVTIDWLKTQPLVHTAARVGARFGVRPSVVLDDDGREFPLLVDTAAAEWLDDREREAEKRSSSGRGGLTSRPTRRARR